MKRDRPSVISRLFRCLWLRCPVCGQSSIVRRLFRIRHHCPSCGALFQREAGFFIGAMMINIVTTEFVILAVYVISLLVVGPNFQFFIRALFTVALLFPVAFYHHSWSIWLSLDHLIESLPKYIKRDSEGMDGESEAEWRKKKEPSREQGREE